ncbi:Ig-like domain-containing protein [Phytohabitans suffuscus]|uniref:Bacterial Ig-like domain-containing protein n=1 Tax=Phytohabitans suffuscus TaxID=624315 RepID=A0A6F8YF29_9ACTN|nr:Ig-like domain-containing protein [Phytohabitans suffuscus]BCB84702.1 hypothetical protein Psuf_020150 [Phytohabitans suffuscus]
MVDRRRRSLRAAALVGACAVVAGGTLVAPAGAQAAVDGDLTINPASGSTTAESLGEYTSANPCPSTHRFAANVQIVQDGTPLTLLVRLSANIFGLSDAAPPPGQLDAVGVGGLAQVFADNGLPSGDYQVALICYNTGATSWTAAASTSIRVDLGGGTWNVIDGGGEEPEPVTTTTSLAAQPTTARAGQPVTLTATVTGSGAAGSVEFLDGTASLGTDDVSGGRATLTVTSLSEGEHSLTAKFVPTDPDDFTPSTSGAIDVTITASNGGGSGGQELNVTVPEDGGTGELTLAVDGEPVTLEQVTSGELVFQGDLGAITVTDGRSPLAGWNVTGFTTDFTGDAGSFGGENLGWAPAVVTPNPADDVVEGLVVAPGGPGLAQPATLASAGAGMGGGATVLGGTLSLEVPAQTQPGDYAATLTITLMGE